MKKNQKLVYILFTTAAEVCYVYKRCVTSELNKPKPSGDTTKRFPFPWYSRDAFWWVFLYAHKDIIFIYIE